MNPWDLSCRSKLPLGANCLLDDNQNHRLLGHGGGGGGGGGLGASCGGVKTGHPLVVPSAAAAADSNNNEHDNNHDHINPYSNVVGNCNSSDSSSNLSPGHGIDKKARKKDQNRRAAYNYRRKKMEERNRMREDEMRLVYSRVCLIGYADELDGSIMYILNSKTRKILDNEGNAICFLCPVCLQSCDNLLSLRNHLKIIHHSDSNR